MVQQLGFYTRDVASEWLLSLNTCEDRRGGETIYFGYMCPRTRLNKEVHLAL